MVDVVLDSHKGFKTINEIWAFISSDETGEGVISATSPTGDAVPLIGADKERLESLLPLARRIAIASKKTIKLIKLSIREDISVIDENGVVFKEGIETCENLGN